MGEKFYLEFKNELPETVEIDEPFGYDSARFVIKQEDKRYARDVSFSDGQIDFEFGEYRNHYLEKILYHIDRYGFETDISLIIEKEGQSIRLDFDCVQGETDGLTYYKCKLIQDAKLQQIKRNNDVKVNLLSDKDLLGNPIQPLVPEKILIKAKPINQKSRFTQPRVSQATTGGIGGVTTRNFNFANNIEDSGIEDTLSFIQGFGNRSDFAYVIAKTTLSDVKIKIKNLNLLSTAIASNSNGYGTIGLFYYIGETMPSTGYLINPIFSTSNNPLKQSNPTFSVNNGNYTINIPVLKVGQKVFIWFQQFVDTQNTTFFIRTDINSMEVEISGISTAFNTVAEGVRLYDVMKYVTKSISGLDIYAPKFDIGSDLYNQYIFSGNLLRNIKGKPFYITMKQIEEGIVEFNADYEIQGDGRLFFGLHRDFYNDVEIAFFNSVQFDEFKSTFNPRFAVNKFMLGYKNYQSQKENTEENTADSVHGESEWKFANTHVDNDREVNIGWIRDAFLIESTRRKSLQEKNNTATQDDDKLFAIDVFPKERIESSLLSFTETAFLQHSYDTTTGLLTLRNDGSFNFTALGIVVDAFIPFQITGTQPNNGTYFVKEVHNNYLVLEPDFNPGNPASAANNGERYTTFKYSIPTSILSGINWTDEDFTSIDNIENGNSYSNLRFSIKRNMLNYHQEYITACNYYNKNKYLASTFYKNNPQAHTVLNGSDVTEGSDFIPNSNMLTPVYFKDIVIIEQFQKYALLASKINTVRGFIRSINKKGQVIKFFPKVSIYEPNKEAITFEGEEKYEPVLINIVSVPNGISINYEYQVSRLKFEVRGDSVLLMDNENELLYNPIFWNRIAVNGNQANDINELKGWLSLLSA